MTQLPTPLGRETHMLKSFFKRLDKVSFWLSRWTEYYKILMIMHLPFTFVSNYCQVQQVTQPDVFMCQNSNFNFSTHNYSYLNSRHVACIVDIQTYFSLVNLSFL